MVVLLFVDLNSVCVCVCVCTKEKQMVDMSVGSGNNVSHYRKPQSHM